VLVRNPRFRVWSTEAQPQGYPDKIIERYRYTGTEAIHAVERGRADITANGYDQTWPPALAASLRTRYSSRLYPAPQLTMLGLWLNTRLAPFNDVRVRQAFNLAVDRNRLAEINAGGVACQYVPPNVNGYSYYCPYNGPNLTRARRLVAESGTRGQSITIWIYDIPAGHRNAAYLIPVLRSIGYKARVEYVPHDGRLTWRPGRQAGVQGWGAGDYPSTGNVFLAFLCSSITTNPKTNGNFAGLCDRRLDAQVARAVSLETSDPAAAAGAWKRADRMLTDEAPWLPMKVFLSTDFVSRRVGNYRYCWLSGGSGLTGACLDQLWVR
jgi:peptide/nickel transport system substrate-binding protein